jgi:hypothetical protein
MLAILIKIVKENTMIPFFYVVCRLVLLAIRHWSALYNNTAGDVLQYLQRS